MNRVTWPMAAIVVAGLGFVFAIFAIIPQSMPEARTALLGVITAGGNALVLYMMGLLQRQNERTEQKVEQIAQQTNGHMTTLIQAKTQPDRDVSRETLTPDGSELEDRP